MSALKLFFIGRLFFLSVYFQGEFMNEKTMITILVSSFLVGTIWLGFNTSQSSDEALKQELSLLKKELDDLRGMLAKNASVEPVLIQANRKSSQSIISSHNLSEQQRSALLTELLQMPIQEVKATPEIDEIKSLEEELRLEAIALEKESLQGKRFVDYLNSELEQEDVDANWSAKIEQHLWDKYDEKELQKASLLTADCRSTFCRISFQNNGVTNFNPSLIMIDTFPNSEGFYSRTVDGSGLEITEFFVSRKNYHLPTSPTPESEYAN